VWSLTSSPREYIAGRRAAAADLVALCVRHRGSRTGRRDPVATRVGAGGSDSNQRRGQRRRGRDSNPRTGGRPTFLQSPRRRISTRTPVVRCVRGPIRLPRRARCGPGLMSTWCIAEGRSSTSAEATASRRTERRLLAGGRSVLTSYERVTTHRRQRAKSSLFASSSRCGVSGSRLPVSLDPSRSGPRIAISRDLAMPDDDILTLRSRGAVQRDAADRALVDRQRKAQSRSRR